MTDSMKFGPEWLRNMSNDMGSSASGGGGGGGGGGTMSNNNYALSTSSISGSNNIGTHTFSNSNSNQTTAINATNNINNNINSNSSTSLLGGGVGGGGNGGSGSAIVGQQQQTPRYQLAEFRYGREEMLSLFDKAIRLPEILPRFKKLFIDKIQNPLALSPNTEDDVTQQRSLWPIRSSSSSIGIATRGGARGGSVDRGRGRGRGSYHSTIGGGFQRSSSMYDEDARGGGRVSWNGSSSGAVDPTEWNGGTGSSPRKEYMTRSATLENWRKGGRMEEEVPGSGSISATGASEAWRGIGTATGYNKWSRSQSWRDDDPTAFLNSSEPPLTRPFSLTSSGERSLAAGKPQSGPSGARKQLSAWEDDNLPEWAMDEPIEGGGSFDATGAFHGPDDDNDAAAGTATTGESGTKSGNNISQAAVTAPMTIATNPTVPSPSLSSSGSVSSSSPPTTSAELDEKPAAVVPPAIVSETPAVEKITTVAAPPVNEKDDDFKNINHTTSASLVTSAPPTTEDPIVIADDLGKDALLNDRNHQPPQQHRLQHPQHQLQQQYQNHNDDYVHAQHRGAVTATVPAPPPPQIVDMSSVDRMKEVADDMVEKLIMDDEMTGRQHSPIMLKKPSGPSDHGLPAHMMVMPGDVMQQQQQQHHLMTSLTSGNSSSSAAPNDLWFYRDPQGKVQGPFAATEMAEWYRAGYFDENLYVRRVCDTRYAALGDLVRLCGNTVPFASSRVIPPLHQIDMSAAGGVRDILSPSMSSMPQAPQHQTPKPPQSMQHIDPDTMNALNYQMQVIQKQYLLRQQAIIMQKLTTSEPWALLTPDQQNVLVNQHMSQISLPEHLLNGSGLPPNLTIQQLLLANTAAAANKSVSPALSGTSLPSNLSAATASKPLHKQQSPPTQQALFNHHDSYGTSPTGPNDSVQQLLNNMCQIQPGTMPSPATVQMLHASANATMPNDQLQHDKDPIKILMMQLARQKGQQIKPIPHPEDNKNTGWMGTTSVPPPSSAQHQLPHHMQQPPPMSMWDIPMPPTPMLGSKPEMKTESQILEEQMSNHLNKHQQQLLKEKHIKDDDMEFDAMLWKLKNKQVPMQQPQIHQQQQQMMHQQILKQQELQHHLQLQAESKRREREQELQQQQQQQHQQLQQQQQQQQQQQLKLQQQMLEKNRREVEEKKLKQEQEKLLKQQQQAKKEIATARKDSKTVQDDAGPFSSVGLSAAKKKEAEDTKRKAKELKKQQLEDDRRRQIEEEKQRVYMEEKKRLDDIAEQRKAKLMDGIRAQQSPQQRNTVAANAIAPVAPWSTLTAATGGALGAKQPSLAEIQKAERERRAEQSRIEQVIRDQQHTQNLIETQLLKDSALKWNLKPQNVKSLAEIQAEESKRQQALANDREHQMAMAAATAAASAAAAATAAKKRGSDDQTSMITMGGALAAATSSLQQQQQFASIWNNNVTVNSTVSGASSMWNSSKMWGSNVTAAPSNTSGGGFWEEPTKTVTMSSVAAAAAASAANKTNNQPKALVKSQTVSNMQQAAAKSTAKANAKPITKAISSANVSQPPAVVAGKAAKSTKKDAGDSSEFSNWCCKALSAHADVIDVPTFVVFLRDIDSPFEVKDYIRMYLGETKECTEFAKQFLERRSKYKSQQRAANAHIDDMCQPAPAITPSNDFQEVKGKGNKKEKKKNKMLKLDSRILGFSVTAAQDRLNVGDRDYGDAP